MIEWLQTRPCLTFSPNLFGDKSCVKLNNLGQNKLLKVWTNFLKSRTWQNTLKSLLTQQGFEGHLLFPSNKNKKHVDIRWTFKIPFETIMTDLTICSYLLNDDAMFSKASLRAHRINPYNPPQKWVRWPQELLTRGIERTLKMNKHLNLMPRQ